MTVYFTADLHLGNTGALNYRPFTTERQMDKAIIKNFNSNKS